MRRFVHPLPIYQTTMNTPTTPQARVSKITVGRLHNLGNYEHVRYEIAVDVPEGASATQTLSNVERVLAGLDPKPPVSDYDLERAYSALKKPLEEWPEWEQGNREAYVNYIEKNKAWIAAQKLAREALDDIGGTRIYTDAKEKWDDNSIG